MGLLEKIKSTLFDTVVIEVPDDEQEEVKKNIEKPKIELREKMDEDTLIFRTKEVLKPEEKKSSSIDLTLTGTHTFNEPVRRTEPRHDARLENSFTSLEQSSSNRKSSTMDVLNQSIVRERQNDIKYAREEKPIRKETKQPEKIFKPTPIISPVYGILEKDYSPESSNAIKKEVYNEEISLESVRKKAFGQFNDEEIIDQDEPKDLKEEKNKSFDELLLDTINIPVKKDDSDEILSTYEDEVKFNKKDEKDDEPIETDLFSLIDSMYEKESEDK